MNTSIPQNLRFSKHHLAPITFVLLLVATSRMLRLYAVWAALLHQGVVRLSPTLKHRG